MTPAVEHAEKRVLVDVSGDVWLRADWLDMCFATQENAPLTYGDQASEVRDRAQRRGRAVVVTTP
jgi:hypothetical protein